MGQVYLVDSVHDIWTREAQEVIVSHQGVRVVLEFRPPEVALLQPVLLDHGPHPTVQDHDPPLEDAPEFCLQRTVAGPR